MVSVEGVVSVFELEMRIGVREPELHDLLVLQELELLKGLLEVLHLAEDLGQILVVVKIEFWVKGVLSLEGLEVQDCVLADLVSGPFCFFRDLDLEVVVARGVHQLDAVVLFADTVHNLLQLRYGQAELDERLAKACLVGLLFHDSLVLFVSNVDIVLTFDEELFPDHASGHDHA